VELKYGRIIMNKTSKKLLSILLILCVTISIVTFLMPVVAVDTEPMIAVGTRHSLALKTDGTVWA
jgi:hypothetical protein